MSWFDLEHVLTDSVNDKTCQDLMLKATKDDLSEQRWRLPGLDSSLRFLLGLVIISGAPTSLRGAETQL